VPDPQKAIKERQLKTTAPWMMIASRNLKQCGPQLRSNTSDPQKPIKERQLKTAAPSMMTAYKNLVSSAALRVFGLLTRANFLPHFYLFH
jgi:hypothetical protein